MTRFCGNMILKIAPLQRPSAVASCAGSSPLLKHYSFIAHYHPTLISSRVPCLDIWWRRLCGGGVVATIKLVYAVIGWWDPFNLLWLLQGPPPALLPLALPALTASLHNSVLSLFQGEYQLCTGRRGLAQTTQLICIHVENTWAPRAALLLYKTWHSHHRGSTSPTVTAVRGFIKDHSIHPSGLFFDFSSVFSHNSNVHFVVCCLSNWENATIIIWVALSVTQFSPPFLGLFHWGCSFIWFGRRQQRNAIQRVVRGSPGREVPGAKGQARSQSGGYSGRSSGNEDGATETSSHFLAAT